MAVKKPSGAVFQRRGRGNRQQITKGKNGLGQVSNLEEYPAKRTRGMPQIEVDVFDN